MSEHVALLQESGHDQRLRPLVLPPGSNLAIPEAGFTTNPPVLNDTVRLCRGQSLAFTNTSIGAESYRWEFGDGTSSTELNPVHDYADAGLYRVALITYNECLCTDTAFVMVQVDPAIAPQVTCRGTVCEGTAVTYTTDADCGTFAWTVSANGTITDGGGPADRFITIDWAGGQEGIITLQVSNCNNATYCPAPNELRVPVISESASASQRPRWLVPPPPPRARAPIGDGRSGLSGQQRIDAMCGSCSSTGSRRSAADYPSAVPSWRAMPAVERA